MAAVNNARMSAKLRVWGRECCKCKVAVTFLTYNLATLQSQDCSPHTIKNASNLAMLGVQGCPLPLGEPLLL